jgi:hypothetical protein
MSKNLHILPETATCPYCGTEVALENRGSYVAGFCESEDCMAAKQVSGQIYYVPPSDPGTDDEGSEP